MSQLEMKTDLDIQVLNNRKNSRIVFLGGLREIGKSSLYIENDEDAVVIDFGIGLNNSNQLEVPNLEYLKKRKNKIRALFLTHGHEDHIGGVKKFHKELKKINVFSSEETTLFLKYRHGIILTDKFKVIEKYQWHKFGSISILAFNVRHSVPGALGYAIKINEKIIINTGDFSFVSDNHNDINELNKLKKFIDSRIDLLIVDSTNSLVQSNNITEKDIEEEFKHIFKKEQGNIFATCFTSNITRIQSLIKAAKLTNRKIYIEGRSMLNAFLIGKELGIESFMADFETDYLELQPDNKSLILLSGSQGEKNSILDYYSKSDNIINNNDAVIISAKTIPGNEKNVKDVLTRLSNKTIKIYLSDFANIHTTGHTCREDLAYYVSEMDPVFIIPSHGNLLMHKSLQMRIEEDIKPKFLYPEVGQEININDNLIEFGKIEKSENDYEPLILDEKEMLYNNGIAFVTIPRYNNEFRNIQMSIRGFFNIEKNLDFIQNAIIQIEGTAQNSIYEGSFKNKEIKDAVKTELIALFKSRYNRVPWIIIMIINF